MMNIEWMMRLGMIGGAILFGVVLYSINVLLDRLREMESKIDRTHNGSILWFDVRNVLPPDGKCVLVSDGKGIDVGWWAPEWKAWCFPGSRDLIPSAKFMRMWRPFPNLPTME